eukprot:7970775-Karenia_brevis.AAC.1
MGVHATYSTVRDCQQATKLCDVYWVAWDWQCLGLTPDARIVLPSWFPCTTWMPVKTQLLQATEQITLLCELIFEACPG